jgi:large subunit ribosomal protein L37Ae
MGSTKKAGIVGKYGCRYGATNRKVIKRMEIQQHISNYPCAFCGKNSIKRVCVGIWKCRAKQCGKTMAGGAYCLSTPVAETVRTAVSRLKKIVKSE